MSTPRRAPLRGPALATPFQRLARTHALMAAGDVFMTIALADSLFLSISPGEARNKVLAFLLVSIAPFAVIAPLIGPTIDRIRGGRRMVVMGVAASRVVITLLMATYIDNLALFPLAFAALVLQKTYSISKSSLVPVTVRRDSDLVEANGKLGVISGVVGFIAAVPAGLTSLISPKLTLSFGSLVFVLALLSAIRLPADTRSTAPPAGGPGRRRRLVHAPTLLLGATAMGFLRASVGFTFFHLAFWFRDRDAGTAWFGLAIALSAVAIMLGNIAGPFVRRRMREEVMLITAMTIAAAAAFGSLALPGSVAGVVLAVGVNFGAALGRLAFDSLVQRDPGTENRGRAFAEFETRFQIAWVAAGVVPVLIPLPGVLGFVLVGAMAAFAVVTFVIGSKRLGEGRPLPEPLRSRAGRELRRRVEARKALDRSSGP